MGLVVRIFTCLSFVMGVLGLACCREHVEKVKISGEVVYDGYTTGEIVLSFCEDETLQCNRNVIEGVTPGKCTEEIVLPEPGSFEVTVKLNGFSDDMPNIDILARNKISADNVWCEEGVDASAILTLPPKNNDSIVVELQNESCQMRD